MGKITYKGQSGWREKDFRQLNPSDHISNKHTM